LNLSSHRPDSTYNISLLPCTILFLYIYPLVLHYATLFHCIAIPPAALQRLRHYNSQASTHRVDRNMVDQDVFDSNATTTPNNSWVVNTAVDLAKLRNAGTPLSSQELKDMNARIKAFEEMAKMEDRLRALETRKRSRL
jgi:hypothetical protein